MENVISDDLIISMEDRIAIAEIDYIIHHMNERYLNKIPQNIRDYLTIFKKRNLDIYVDPKIPLEKQGLKDFTLCFLMILNLKYWCNDEERKALWTKLEQGQREYNARIYNIFDKAESMQSVSSNENVNNEPKKINVVENTSVENAEPTTNVDVISELKNEEKSITTTSNENIFSKIINIIKSKFLRK